jgi:predicted amidohydrolase YtcJ
MDETGRVHQALAVRQTGILGLPIVGGLDELIGPGKQVADGAGLTVLPAFEDTPCPGR